RHDESLHSNPSAGSVFRSHVRNSWGGVLAVILFAKRLPRDTNHSPVIGRATFTMESNGNDRDRPTDVWRGSLATFVLCDKCRPRRCRMEGQMQDGGERRCTC